MAEFWKLSAESGGGDMGGHNLPLPVTRSPASRTFFCPFVSRPLLCFSRYHVNHAVWLPILIGSALALSKIKNCVVNRTISHSPARSLKRHSFDTSLHHAAVQCFVDYSRTEGAPRKVFHERIFTHHIEKYRDRSKWSLKTFYLTRFVVLTENFDS